MGSRRALVAAARVLGGDSRESFATAGASRADRLRAARSGRAAAAGSTRRGSAVADGGDEAGSDGIVEASRGESAP